jgi:hypothetical protein
VYISVIHFLCWNCECWSLWLVAVMLLKSEHITLLGLCCCSFMPADIRLNFVIEL